MCDWKHQIHLLTESTKEMTFSWKKKKKKKEN